LQGAAQIGEGLFALGAKAAVHDLSVGAGTGLPGDEQQVSELDALRQQEGLVRVGVGDDTFQHDGNPFNCGRRLTES
jgi:hypothetical protein